MTEPSGPTSTRSTSSGCSSIFWALRNESVRLLTALASLLRTSTWRMGPVSSSSVRCTAGVLPRRQMTANAFPSSIGSGTNSPSFTLRAAAKMAGVGANARFARRTVLRQKAEGSAPHRGRLVERMLAGEIVPALRSAARLGFREHAALPRCASRRECASPRCVRGRRSATGFRRKRWRSPPAETSRFSFKRLMRAVRRALSIRSFARVT